jgi:hypothetical protein
MEVANSELTVYAHESLRPSSDSVSHEIGRIPWRNGWEAMTVMREKLWYRLR